MIATIEREAPTLLREDHASFSDIPDEMWDSHGLLVAMILLVALIIVSIVAIISLEYCAPKSPTTASAMLIEQSLLGATARPNK